MDDETENTDIEEYESSGTTNKGPPKKTNEGKPPVVEPPSCRHDWCLGEVLRKQGIENGVCCPRPFPWGRPGRLKYLPGWQDLCWDYDCQPACYERRVKKRKDPDKERWKQEVTEAKLLWSYLGPVLSFPGTPVYEDKEPVKACDCGLNYCELLDSPPVTAAQVPLPQGAQPPPQGAQPPPQGAQPPPQGAQPPPQGALPEPQPGPQAAAPDTPLPPPTPL